MKKLHDLTVTASAELQQCWEMGSVINPTTTIRHIVTRLAPVSMRHYSPTYHHRVVWKRSAAPHL